MDIYDDINWVYIVGLDFKDENGMQYMYTKRVSVYNMCFAKKFTARESAYHAYKGSRFELMGIRPVYIAYNRETKETRVMTKPKKPREVKRRFYQP